MYKKRNTSFRVYTPQLQLLAEIDYYESMRLTRSWTSIGDFELHISTAGNVGRFFQRDNVIIIGGDIRKAAFITNRAVSSDESGNEKWVVTGKTLNGITERRITYPTPGKSTQTQRDYSSEAVIIGLVRRNMGIYAEPNRVISFIQTQNSQGRMGVIGKKITWSTRYKRLSEECVEVAKAAELGWWFYPDLAAGKWRIDFSEGNDRTRTSTTPVVFTEDFENLASFEYTEDYNDYANSAIVGGEGEGEARTIVETSTDGGVTTYTDAARYEVFIDARDLQTEEGDDVAITDAELKTRGQTKLLSEFNSKETFEGQVLQTANYEFGVQYDLGDIVTIESKRLGLGEDVRITSVTESYEASGYQLELVFGDEEATVGQKFRRFKGALEGVKNS